MRISFLDNFPRLTKQHPSARASRDAKAKQTELFAAAEEHLQSSLTQKKNLFEDPSFQQQCWSVFQKTVLDNFGDMGAFCQILFLRNAREKLLSLSEIERINNTPPTPLTCSGGTIQR